MTSYQSPTGLIAELFTVQRCTVSLYIRNSKRRTANWLLPSVLISRQITFNYPIADNYSCELTYAC